VRARYDPHSPSWTIGVNHLTADQPLWYALPDLAASRLLAGKSPRVLDAILLLPEGQAEGLSPFTLPGGRIIDPRVDDPFQAMTEDRARVRRDPSLDEPTRDRLQLPLKISSNAGTYGIWAEYNPEDLPAGHTQEVTVYGRGDPFTDQVTHPEHPGRFCYPPLAAVITAAARLFIALLERSVTDLGDWCLSQVKMLAIRSQMSQNYT
jgi:hypothetical protein